MPSRATNSREDHTVVNGLADRTEILIDRWGVPHIYATTAQDAFFTQGWNAARDRLWQIDLWRRSGLGELAAALGPVYTAQDQAIRLFTYRGDMDKEWAFYGADAKRQTRAFVSGINAYVTAVRNNAVPTPPEFKLAGYAPALWNVDDVVRIRNHGLAVGAALQVQRAQLACKTGSVAALNAPPFKIAPPWTPVVPEGLDLCSLPANVLERYQLAQKPVVFAAQAPQALNTADAEAVTHTQGSNNWVIAPSKTRTGRALLANDPHRSLDIPSLRYIAHVIAPGLDIIGAGEPSLPGIAIGHNQTIAFGITVFFIAQEDLYVYETNPTNPDQYRYLNTWEPMHAVQESIPVRGAADARVTLKFTRHGPVVFEDPDHHRAYAVRATWLDTGGAPYFGSMRYLRAKNLQEFSSALKHWGEPGENQIYADARGNIAWFPAGFTPVRPNSDGLLPLPGDGRYEWHGYLDRDQLPSEINPARGYIATANQMDLPKDYPYAQRRVGFFWGDNSRMDRITEVLNGSSHISLEDSQNLQNDNLSLPARRLLQLLRQTATPQAPALQDTLRWLTTWDARVTTQSPQAALYEVWVAHHLGPTVIARIAPAIPASDRALMGMPAPIIDLMEHPDTSLGAHPNQARDELLLQTLAAAEQEMRQLQGADRTHWHWGSLSQILFQHPLSTLADDTLRQQMNAGPAPKAGDGSVVGVAAYRPQDFRTQAGASFRMVLDVGHWDRSVAVNTPGQSGDPSNPHYKDLFPLWLDGKYFPLLYSRAAVERNLEHRIILEPHRQGRAR